MQIRKNLPGISFLLAVLLLSVFTRCHEYTTLGEDIIDHNSTQVVQTDTFTIHTRTIAINQDSVSSIGSTGMELGSINDDPVFGKITSAVYVQFGLVAPGVDYFAGPNPVLDSIVLSLAYFGKYGDSTSPQKFEVYRINDPDFTRDGEHYYVHHKFKIDELNPLGSATVTMQHVQDSVSIFGEKEPPQLRIRLKDGFGESFLTQNGEDVFANDTTFHEWLNGLAILPDTTAQGRSALGYFSLSNDFTGISVFYHNDESDSLNAYFPFNQNTSVWSNYRNHDFTGTPVEEAAQDQNNDSLLYLINNAGIYSNIILPHLEDFPNALINKAELIVTQVFDNKDQVFQSPYELFLWEYKDAQQDTIGYITDVGAVFDQFNGWQFTNLDAFGGVRNAITDQEGHQVAQYTFNITRHLQNLISENSRKETNYGFRLGVLDPLSRSINTGRLVAGGGNHGKYKMKLKVIYSKIE